jgi:hypothetical protein
MKLLIKFPDQSESFTYGVEFGRLLEKIERGDQFISNNRFPIRIENKQLLMETCKKYGYTAMFGKEYYKEWIDFIGIKQTSNN